jgi:hypothetical protein
VLRRRGSTSVKVAAAEFDALLVTELIAEVLADISCGVNVSVNVGRYCELFNT